MLPFRLKKQTSENVADTTFKSQENTCNGGIFNKVTGSNPPQLFFGGKLCVIFHHNFFPGHLYGNSSKFHSVLIIDLDRPIIDSYVKDNMLNLNCTAMGTLPIRYSWYGNGQLISNKSYVSLPNNATYNDKDYKCVVENMVTKLTTGTSGTEDCKQLLKLFM